MIGRAADPPARDNYLMLSIIAKLHFENVRVMSVEDAPREADGGGVPVDPVTWDGILDVGEHVCLPRAEVAALLANA